MRIALLTSGIRGIGSYCLNLYNYLTSKGHKVLLISESKWVKQNVPSLYQAKSILLFGLAPVVYHPLGIVKALKKFKPDIIHYHWPSGTMDVLFREIRKLQVPIIVTLHVAVASKRFFFDKVWFNYFGLFKRNLRRVQAINSISRFVQAQLKSRIKLPQEKLLLIYAGVNTTILKPVKKPTKKGINLIFVGQVMPEKGIDVLIRAVRKVSKQMDITLRIIGDGHLKKPLQRLTRRDKCIKWIGFVKDQKTIAKHYANSDLTVLPTRWDEAFSLVPVESLACGTPVMATNKGGTPELITSGKTGILLKEGDEKEITKALLSLDKEELRLMRKDCRNLVLKKYSLEIMGYNHEKAYKKLIKDFKSSN
ncbi:MAG TPA: glycosyltransferase family 4 protein [Candidatus Nanoarchaeia archaeon]|nr:glycosyltransferase family 4 protein [Candidatus Nanoarchaeia archaeon]